MKTKKTEQKIEERAGEIALNHGRRTKQAADLRRAKRELKPLKLERPAKA